MDRRVLAAAGPGPAGIASCGGAVSDGLGGGGRCSRPGWTGRREERPGADRCRQMLLLSLLPGI